MANIDDETRKRIEQQVQAFRARKVKEAINPPPAQPVLPPEAKLEAALGRTEVLLAQGDKRRIKVLQRMAAILIERGDWRGARGTFMEAVHMCELKILGLGEAYPVISTLPPPPRTGHSTLPALEAENGHDEPEDPDG